MRKIIDKRGSRGRFLLPRERCMFRREMRSKRERENLPPKEGDLICMDLFTKDKPIFQYYYIISFMPF